MKSPQPNFIHLWGDDPIKRSGAEKIFVARCYVARGQEKCRWQMLKLSLRWDHETDPL
jgi:hypothetical protein